MASLLTNQNTYGYIVDSDGFSIGDIIVTNRDLSSDPNWLLCDGSEFDIATYPDLAKVLGYTTTTGTGVLPNASTIMEVSITETTITLPAANWQEQADGSFSQDVTVTANMPSIKLDVVPVYGDDLTENKDILYNFSKICRVTANVRNMGFICFYNKPTIDLDIRVTGYMAVGDTSSTESGLGKAYIKALNRTVV